MNGKENAECSSASAQRASQTRESIKEEKDVRGIHLMLAEDNELNAEIVKALLKNGESRWMLRRTGGKRCRCSRVTVQERIR